MEVNLMSTFTIEIQVPSDLRELGCSDEDIRREVPVLLVLKRFREGVLSSGKSASLLGMSRRDFLDLLAREGVPLYDPSDQEFANELKTIRKIETSAS
jgi:predicted HTH domain antitoxin